MSQHYFSTNFESNPVTVLAGWDRPLQQFFLVIEDLNPLVDASDEEVYIYSNLFDENAARQEFSYFENKLIEIRGKQSSNDYNLFVDVISNHHMSDGRISHVLCDLSELEFVDMMACRYSRKRYMSAYLNPKVIGERNEAVYRSTTLWQAESFCIEVQAGYFWTKEEAEAFGKLPIRLVYDGGSRQLVGQKYLRFTSVGGKPIETPDQREEWLDWLIDEDVSVTKLKASSVGKLVTDITDYEPVNILIEDFTKYPELSSFGMLSYGVKKVAELPI